MGYGGRGMPLEGVGVNNQSPTTRVRLRALGWRQDGRVTGPRVRLRRLRAARGFAALAALLVACTCAAASSDRGVSTGGRPPRRLAEAFKRFLAHPPVIRELFFEYDSPWGSASYFLLKWQPGVVFCVDFGEQADGFTLPEPDPARYPIIIARYGDVYWQKNGSTFYVWTNDHSGARNTLTYTHDVMMETLAAEVLTFGCSPARIGSFQWSGDGFRARHLSTGSRIHGSLQRDAQGRASRITYSIAEKRPDSPGPGPFPWSVDYHYDTPLALPYLPSRIRCSYRDAAGRTQRGPEIRIHSLATSDHPEPRSAFSLAELPDTPSIEAVVTVSNRWLVTRMLAGGEIYARPDPIAMRPLRRRSRRFYYLVAVLVLVVPIILYAWHKRSRHGLESSPAL